MQAGNNGFGERLKLLIEQSGLDGPSFARKIGESKQRINTYTSGKTNPAFDVIQKIVEYFPPDKCYWLITGKKNQDNMP